MLQLNKLALQLELIDEEHTWTTLPGASQDYVIVSTRLMQVQVIRKTEHTYDVALTPDALIDRLWDRPKKTKLAIVVTARTLLALSDAILKRLVTPHQGALERAHDVYQQEIIHTRLANEGLKPFLQRHKVSEENVVWAGVGNHVASYYMEVPDAAVHVVSRADDAPEGALRISHLTLDELEDVIKVLNIIRTKRWMNEVQSMTPSTTAESSPVDSEPTLSEPTETEPVTVETVSDSADDSPS